MLSLRKSNIYKHIFVLYIMTDRIKRGKNILIDLSTEMALGDTILRAGALNIFQSNSCNLYVISEKKEALHIAGIKNILSHKSVDEIISDVDYLIIPTYWAKKSREYWSKKSNLPSQIILNTKILDCDYKQDYSNPLINLGYPFINRVALSFLNQLRENTEFKFETYDIIPRIHTKSYKDKENIGKTILAIGDKASTQEKCWTKYTELVNMLSNKIPNLYFAFIDNNTNFDKTKISQLDNPEKVIYSARRDDPNLATKYMLNAKAFCGNDSGPSHYFAMMNSGLKPMLILCHYKIDPARWTPNCIIKDFIYIKENGEIIDRNSYRYDDWQRTYDLQPNLPISEIPVDAVYSKIQAQLRS
jgi:hypothetical protein